MKKLLNKHYYTLFILFLSGIFFNTHATHHIDYKALTLVVTKYDQGEFPNSIITFVQNPLNTIFVIKQIKFDDNFYRLAQLVAEMLALYIGHSINAPVNVASIIPAGTSFAGKDQHVPVTIHIHVPGIRFDKYRQEKYKDLRLRQKNLAGKPEGLTKALIYHMARHPDLPILVALDTFVGNAGRGTKNFFYEETTDTFYGIDMGSAFISDLCKLSSQTVKQMLLDNTIAFTQSELNGLLVFTKTLKKLLQSHEPKKLLKKIYEYTKESNVIHNPYLNNKIKTYFAASLGNYKKFIQKNYKHAIKLLSLLEKLLKKHGGSID